MTWVKVIESLPELASQQFSIHQTLIHVNDSVNTSYIWIILDISWTSYILDTSGYIWFHAISRAVGCLVILQGYPGPQVEIGIRLGLQKGKHLRNPEESLEESLPVEAAGPVPTEHAELQFQFRNQMTQPVDATRESRTDCIKLPEPENHQTQWPQWPQWHCACCAHLWFWKWPAIDSGLALAHKECDHITCIVVWQSASKLPRRPRRKKSRIADSKLEHSVLATVTSANDRRTYYDLFILFGGIPQPLSAKCFWNAFDV